MHTVVDGFLSLPMHFRATIFIGIILLLWWILGGLILKLMSLIPFLVGKFELLLYKALGLITGALHKAFGRLFAWLDSGVTMLAEVLYNKIDQLYKYLRKPKAVQRCAAFIIALLLAVYVLLPYYCNWDHDFFTFWKSHYAASERNVLQWMDRNGWLR